MLTISPRHDLKLPAGLICENLLSFSPTVHFAPEEGESSAPSNLVE